MKKNLFLVLCVSQICSSAFAGKISGQYNCGIVDLISNQAYFGNSLSVVVDKEEKIATIYEIGSDPSGTRRATFPVNCQASDRGSVWTTNQIDLRASMRVIKIGRKRSGLNFTSEVPLCVVRLLYQG